MTTGSVRKAPRSESSSSRSFGSRPVSARMRSTSEARSPRSSWQRETFTAMRIGGSPAPIQDWS